MLQMFRVTAGLCPDPLPAVSGRHLDCPWGNWIWMALLTYIRQHGRATPEGRWAAWREGGSPEWAPNLSCDPASPVPSAEPSILGSAVSPPAQSPSPQHSAPFLGSRAVSQPSICSPWHGTSLKFLKIAGMVMPPAPLSPTPRQILLFLYPLQGPFCHVQKEVA